MPSPAVIEADARALAEAGRFEEALGLLRPLVGGETVEAGTLFLYGLVAVRGWAGGAPPGGRA
ncbi:MAG: hypothetical protein OXQ29_15170, partial [Rhodospirillaceae bacterium]|nr:hypothetical protein [Rhodospirillaceae bacterium]